MNKYITKRDGTTASFDSNKIENVLKLAFKNTNVDITNDNLNDIMTYINEELEKKDVNNYNIEEIQDLVEKTLMLFKYFSTAKHYINYRTEHNKNRDNCSYLSKIPDNINTPWGMLGYITYKRTYARRLNENDDNDETTEEYRDTILRILKGCQKQLNVNFTNKELEMAYKYLMELKCSVAGRFLWQLGTETISKLGIMSLQNCAFVKIDDPIKPFIWIFDVLMLGTGVGFNIQQENIKKLPPVLNVDIQITRKDTKDADFIIPDSREGWVSLLEKVFEAYFYKGNSFSYSTLLIRSAGTKIKGFGGVASGPEDLVKGINLIQGILNNKKGKCLSSVDCLDIVNIIASVVVAGNVRRCIPVGSKIHTKLGLINIEDIIIGDEVLTTNGYKKVKNVFKQGFQDIYKIKTLNGEFKCTKNHKMAVFNEETKEKEWVLAENLNKGDKLILSKMAIQGNSFIKLPSFEYSSNRKERILTPDFTEDICWFFGYISQNKPQNKNSFNINCNSLEILKKIIKILDKFGTYSLRIITDIDIKNNYYNIEVISASFYNYMNTYFTNNIPYFINETTYLNRLAFISGIIDNNKIKENLIIIENASTDISNLLYSCGIIHTYKNNQIYIQEPVILNEIKNSKNLISTLVITNEDKNKIITINQCKVMLSEVEEFVYDNNYYTYDIEVEEIHEFFCNGYLTHNSALICLGDYDDIEYLNAKRWDLGNIPNWRCMSNNSVVCDDISKLPDEFWNGYNGNGEPYGLINIELSKKIGRIKDGDKYPDPEVEGFNPCLTGDTIILTRQGLVKIKNLIGNKFDAFIYDNYYSCSNNGFWHSGNKEVYKITLKNGCTIKATSNHQFKTSNGWKEVSDLTIKDNILICNNSNYKWEGGEGTENEGYIMGFLLNSNITTNTYRIPFIKFKTIGLNENREPLNKIIEICDTNYTTITNRYDDIYETSVLSDMFVDILNKFQLDKTDKDIYIFQNISYSFTIGLLKGIMDNENTIIIEDKIIIKNNNCRILRYIQQLLFAFGINNTYNETDMNIIIDVNSIYHLNNLIGFTQQNKKEKIEKLILNKNKDDYYTSVITSIEKLNNNYDVYDCTIPYVNSFVANGIISHNCAEQSLANYETCCLSEIYLCNIHSYEELKEIATIMYRICKHSLLLKCHQKETEKIVHKNLRMGIGITGYLQSTKEQKEWLNDLYEYLREFDKEYSLKIGVPTSIKLTTVKPSGTLSLLAGVTSGAHPAIYQYFIRRIRISSSNTSLIELAKSHHYYIEYQKNFDGTDDKNTMIIEFPCRYPDGTILAKDMSAVDQLNTIKELQTNWSDNAVSVTVYYKLNELPEIKQWLIQNYTFNVKSCSFLLHNDHGFKQAPFEEITKEKYEELIKKVIPITKGKLTTLTDGELTSDCAGGSCPIR